MILKFILLIVCHINIKLCYYFLIKIKQIIQLQKCIIINLFFLIIPFKLILKKLIFLNLIKKSRLGKVYLFIKKQNTGQIY